jgi:molybdopterin/thiamine biosynthesis adenylyltransferase
MGWRNKYMPDATGLYSRQEQLELKVPNSVTIVGVGGVGSWVAIDLAMSGVPNLYLFDTKVLTENNRNRLPFCQGGVNLPKVEVVANFINGIRPDCVVVPINERLDGLLLKIQLTISEWIVDCTDSPSSQYKIYNACRSVGKNFVRAGYDGTHITVTSNVSGWIKQSVEENYAINPSWVVPSQIVAAMAVAKIMKYPAQEVSLDIAEIGIPVLQKQASKLTPRCIPNNAGIDNRYSPTPRERLRNRVTV